MVRNIQVIFVEEVIYNLTLLHVRIRFFLSIIQNYILNWYHMHILYSGMVITEEIICQKIYWNGIIDAIWKEVRNCDTCQRTKQSNKNMVNYQ